MIDTERKEDLFLDTKLIKSENRLGKLRIIDELHPVLGGQPTHEKDQPNDNNPFLDLACTMQFTIDKVNAVDKKADTKLAKAQNLKDVANVAIARDNLGLGTSATMNATSTLSDRTDQTVTPKMVNNVNRDVVTAQKTANTANEKANAAQTTANQAKSAAATADSKATSAQSRADDAYNLANSKWSPQATTGTGNIARMSEVDKKMSDGAYGLGNNLNVPGNDLNNAMRPGFYKWETNVTNTPTSYGSAIVTSWDGKGTVSCEQLVMKNGNVWVRGKNNDRSDWIPWNKVALTSDIPSVVQSTGSSTTSVMSQKVVTDQLNSIKNSHGLGYGQRWQNVSGSRVSGTTYTNNTGKPIMLNIGVLSNGESYSESSITVDGLLVARSITRFSGHEKFSFASAVIPAGSSYRFTNSGQRISQTIVAELR